MILEHNWFCGWENCRLKVAASRRTENNWSVNIQLKIYYFFHHIGILLLWPFQDTLFRNWVGEINCSTSLFYPNVCLLMMGGLNSLPFKALMQPWFLQSSPALCKKADIQTEIQEGLILDWYLIRLIQKSSWNSSSSKGEVNLSLCSAFCCVTWVSLLGNISY